MAYQPNLLGSEIALWRVIEGTIAGHFVSIFVVIGAAAQSREVAVWFLDLAWCFATTCIAAVILNCVVVALAQWALGQQSATIYDPMWKGWPWRT